MKGLWKRFCAVGLAAVLTVSMAACGGETEEGAAAAGNGTGTADGEYVYVPTYYSMDLGKNGWIGSVAMENGKFFYSVYDYNEENGSYGVYCAYRDLNSPDTQVMITTEFAVEGYETTLWHGYMDEDDNLYTLWSVYAAYVEGEEYDYGDSTYYLVKYDSAGTQVFARDLAEVFVDENNSYLQQLLVTKEGKLVASASDLFYVFDSDGTLETTISSGTDWIQSMCITEDDKVLACGYGTNGMEVYELDLKSEKVGNTYKNIPEYSGLIKSEGTDKLLVSGSSKLYEYDCTTQEYTELLTWTDCDVDGSYIQEFALLEDGRIAVYYDNYEEMPQIIILTKKPASEVVQKEIITVAILYEGNTDLQQAVVAFNKANDKYRVEIRSYIASDAEWTDTTYADGLALMNADMVSKDAPDIVCVNYVNVESLVSKGAFEDLTPYLEASTIAKREDFLESVLEAYNYDGVQVCVPTSFSLTTLMAKSTYVGTEPGWTLEDVITLAKEYPEASLMQYMTKDYALQLCLQFNVDSFIDYETGSCNFDSEEFIQVLEFADCFPLETIYDDDFSYPAKIQSGQVLLSDVYLGSVQEYQMYYAMFEEEATCIGYPTIDGSVGVYLNGSSMYAISSSCDCKEGAWAFIESTLAKKDNSYSFNFPSRKDELEEMFAEAMEPEYQYDENGEIMYDEDGNALQNPKTTWGYNDWETEIYAATQEEIDEIRAIIEMAKPFGSSDQTIYTMISEEAQSYFNGQKSAEDVAKVIQSRVEIYVSENS